MEITQDITIEKMQINKHDFLNFCKILESKSLEYTAEVSVKGNKRYTFKYNGEDKEENIFASTKLDNLKITKIEIKSNYCNLFFGENCENVITFNGDERDGLYNSLFSEVSEWQSRLKKLYRINFNKNETLTVVLTVILPMLISISYFFISLEIEFNFSKTLICAIVLLTLLITSFSLYICAYKSYEINIGNSINKKLKNSVYFLFTSCILPIIFSLIL